MRKCVVVACLLLSTLVLAAGTVEAFPGGEKWHQARLAQVRKENLQSGVRGPLATRVLRYRDVWKGQKRTFVWSAQKFENPDGTTAYAVVMTQLLADGKQKLMLAGGSTYLELVGDDDPHYQMVYNALNDYIRQHQLGEKF